MAKTIQQQDSRFLNPAIQPYPEASPYLSDAENAAQLEENSRLGFLQSSWARALRSGAFTTVTQMLNGNLNGWAQISPNFSPTDGGTNPITYMARHDSDTSAYMLQRLTAHALINAGIELRVPDARQLLPADYALMSANTELASAVVMETIKQFENRQGGEPYRPNFMTYFASEPASFNIDSVDGQLAFDERARFNAFTNLKRNHDIIGNILRDRSRNHKDMLVRGMDEDQLGFWLKPLSYDHKRLTYGRLPRPPFELEELHGLIVSEASTAKPYIAGLSARKDWDAERFALEKYTELQAEAARAYTASPHTPAF